jgi:trans-aconitate methyltransferase
MADGDDWEEHWRRYDEAARRNPAQQMRHRLVLRLLRPRMTRNVRLLDIGSGQGDLLARIHTAFPDATLAGVELSERGVAVSRRKVPAANFLVADLFQPPATLAEYRNWATLAVCSEVLEHVDSPADLLRAARSLLADNGTLVVTVPGGPMSAFDRHIGHRQHFTRASIQQVLEQAGFTVERICRAGFPFFNLYRLVVIARGERLSADVDATHTGISAALASLVMTAFRCLLRLILLDSPFGWQVLAIARKSPGAPSTASVPASEKIDLR